jgi:hypothetical protein
MQEQALAEHQWLRRLRGEWSYESTALMGNFNAPEKVSGVESVRSLGDLWVVAGGHGGLPGGGEASTVMTLGFDPLKKRYVGTWVGSMMTWLWAYDGTLDAGGQVLTLNTEGPSLDNTSTLCHYRDVIEWLDDDHRVLTSHALRDGRWTAMMISHYHRTPRPAKKERRP